MIYQQDWLMRQIEAMIQAILAVALGISANEQTATQIEDSSYGKMLEKMIGDGDICAAEDISSTAQSQRPMKPPSIYRGQPSASPY